MFTLGKFSLVILTRCNLRCSLCCEYVPQNKPFPDMTINEAKQILEAAFATVDHIRTLHLTGGGEPFLHPHLAQMIELSMEYADQFDVLMLFTNCTIPISQQLMETIVRFKDKILVQASRYGQFPEREEAVVTSLQDNGIRCKVVKYYGEDQDFDGWVDFGPWEAQGNEADVLEKRFHACAVTSVMEGNWRTRDGKVHWCSRSQRGMELGLIPDVLEDYVDLLDTSESREEKRNKFQRIAESGFISACDHCSGDQGTDMQDKRHPAAEQLKDSNRRSVKK